MISTPACDGTIWEQEFEAIIPIKFLTNFRLDKYKFCAYETVIHKFMHMLHYNACCTLKTYNYKYREYYKTPHTQCKATHVM